MIKCEVCGGTLSSVTNNLLKCDYCGKLYVQGDEITEANPEQIYETANAKAENNTQNSLQEAIVLYTALGTYKDSDIREMQCRRQIEENRIWEQEQELEEQRYREQQQIKRRKLIQSIRKYVKIAMISCGVALIVFLSVWGTIKAINNKKQNDYERAQELYVQQQYEESLQIYEKLGNYQDAEQKAEMVRTVYETVKKEYAQGVDYYQKGLYEQAIDQLQTIAGYSDVADYLSASAEALYQQAEEAMAAGEYSQAQQKCQAIPEDSDVATKAKTLALQAEEAAVAKDQETRYQQALSYYNNSDYSNAQAMFINLGDYKDARDYLNQIGNYYYSKVQEAFEQSDYRTCGEMLSYIDSSEKWMDYQRALELKKNIQTVYRPTVVEEAKNICRSEGQTQMVNYVYDVTYGLFDEQEITALKNECTIHTVRLSELTPYVEESTSRLDFISSSYEDNMGNTYSDGLRGDYCPSHMPKGSKTFAIDKQYQYLYGTVAARPYSHVTDESKGFINIYGDGNLIWSANIDRYTKPYDVEVNIGEVTDLKIEIYTNYDSISVLFANIILSE